MMNSVLMAITVFGQYKYIHPSSDSLEVLGVGIVQKYTIGTYSS